MKFFFLPALKRLINDRAVKCESLAVAGIRNLLANTLVPDLTGSLGESNGFFALG